MRPQCTDEQSNKSIEDKAQVAKLTQGKNQHIHSNFLDISDFRQAGIIKITQALVLFWPKILLNFVVKVAKSA